MTDQGPEPSRPGGTVYGRGGVDVREPRDSRARRLHPAVTALAVVAGVIVVVAVGYWTWRDPTALPKIPEVPEFSAPAVAAPVASAPAAAPSPTAERLSTGSWLISAAGDPETRLGREGVFAAMSSGDPTVLTTTRGLADDSCFSFRDEQGRYLRHFDYRLRFDAPDDSDLFRKDATFCPEGDQPAGTLRLHSKNYPDHVVHRRGTKLYIDKPDGSGTFVADSSFAVWKPPSS